MPKRTSWCIPVPRALDVALEQAVKQDTYSTKSDFVRDAVRRKLENMGFHPQAYAKAFAKEVSERERERT